MKKNQNLFAINGMYWVTSAVFLPFIGAYYTSIGMRESQVGILAAVIPLASLLIQPVWAYISDRTGKRRTVLVFLCIGCAGSILFFSRAATFLSCLSGILIYAVFSSALLPLSDALVIKAADQRGVNFAYIRMTGTITYAITVLLVGRLLSDQYRIIFLISSASFLLYSLCCMTLRPEKGAGVAAAVKAGKEAGAVRPENRAADSEPAQRGLFCGRQIIAIFLCAFAMQFGLNYHGTFLSVYLVGLGFDNGVIGIMSCVSALSEVPVLLLMKKIKKRFSIMQLLTTAIVLCSLRLFLVSSGNIVLIAAAQLLQGPSFMICYFSCVTYISEHVLSGRISQGQSMLALVQNGLGCIFGSLAGGMLAERLGIRKGFWVVGAAILVLAAAALRLDRYLQEQKEKGGRTDGSFSV